MFSRTPVILNQSSVIMIKSFPAYILNFILVSASIAEIYCFPKRYVSMVAEGH